LKLALLAGAFAIGTGSVGAETLSYRASLYNLTLGEGQITVTEGVGSYGLAARLRTSGVGAMFDTTDLTVAANGARGASGISWQSYNLSHSYNRKFRRTTMTNGPSGPVATIAPAYSDMGRPATSQAQKRGAYDPLSAFYLLGRTAGAGGCDARVAVFDGRHRYDLVMTPIGAGNVRVAGYSGPVMRCALRYVPIAGYNPTRANERREIPTGEIQFAPPASAGGFSYPVRVRVPTPVGMASLTLTRRTA
jgi:Protein of unknown function (DUF3108)